MKHLMVGVDGSASSHHAVKVAVELAAAQNAELTLCYISVPIVYPVEMGWVRVAEAETAQREFGARLLAGLASEFQSAGAKIDTQLEDGSVATKLLEIADSRNADCLVLGSRGHGVFGRFFLGSVTDRILHLSRKPVLVVHDH